MKYLKAFWNWGWGIYHKNEELWNYLITGAIGVVISVVSYALCRKMLFSIVLSNFISWIIAVISMYFMNKYFVFKTRANSKVEVVEEFFAFVAARIFTLVVETGILYLGSEIINMNDIFVKIIAQITIIILNYILSKLFIFKKKA